MEQQSLGSRMNIEWIVERYKVDRSKLVNVSDEKLLGVAGGRDDRKDGDGEVKYSPRCYGFVNNYGKLI